LPAARTPVFLANRDIADRELSGGDSMKRVRRIAAVNVTPQVVARVAGSGASSS